MAGRGSQQRPIGRLQHWPSDLPTQDLKLVAEHQQLDVFHVQAATATHERAEQSTHGEVEKREGHASDPRNPLLLKETTPIFAPFTPLRGHLLDPPARLVFGEGLRR